MLSQVLVWSSILSAPSPDVRMRRYLRLDPVPSFQIEQPIGDDELTSIEVVDAVPEAPEPTFRTGSDLPPSEGDVTS